MRILVSGASGLVGSSAIRALEAKHDILRLVRRPPASDGEVQWSPDTGVTATERLAGVDAVLHLAGENVASGRWSAERKKRIRSSRVDGTTRLCASLEAAGCRPKAFVSASAIGYYGSRGDEVMVETSQPGDDFLAETCVAWEAASSSCAQLGCRVAQLRIGVVLSRDGGALARMLPAFRWGAGGRLGNGRQYFSWITIDDLTSVIVRALEDDSFEGAYNAVAPHPVTNADLTRTLGKILRRPTIFPVPAFAVKTLFGEMGEALLLSSTRVQPKRLSEAGFEFRFAHLEAALRHLLGKGR